MLQITDGGITSVSNNRMLKKNTLEQLGTFEWRVNDKLYDICMVMSVSDISYVSQPCDLFYG